MRPILKPRYIFLFLTFVLTLLVSGCQPLEAGPTPTPTRTPIIPTATPTLTPTVTPTATPTITPTPTPTLPAGLLLPATPIKVDSYLPIPSDLYFLRDGVLWLWGAEGGDLQKIALGTDTDGEKIVAYRITPDRNYIAYITDAAKLYAFDSANWQSAYIPTSGDILYNGKAWFEISNDGSAITYMAWHTHPETEQPPIENNASYGTVLTVDRLNPRQRQKQVGFCTTVGDRPCMGFTLSPDQSKAVIADGRGLWLHTQPEGELTFITQVTTLLTPVSWSSDSQKVLFAQVTATTDRASAGYVVLDLTAAPSLIQRNLDCGDSNCIDDVAWNDTQLWISSDGATQGCLAGWSLNEEQTLPEFIVCKITGWLLHPTSPLAPRDSQVSFLHHGCGENCEGPGAGVYQFTPPDTFTPIALLPESGGSLLWNSNGNAFLYLDNQGNPAYLGSIAGAQSWDVKALLQGSYAFTWVHPSSGIE